MLSGNERQEKSNCILQVNRTFFFSVFYLTETFQNLNRDLNWQLAGDKHVTCINKALKEEKKTRKPS